MKNVLTSIIAFALLTATALNVAVAADQSNKPVVETLLAAINDYDVDAARDVLRPEYRQHNPYIPDGSEGLLSLWPAIEEAGVTVETVLLLEDGDNVVAFNRWGNAEIFGHGCNDMVAFDFYAVHEDGRLSAHWDAMTCERERNASGRLISDRISKVTDLEHTEDNKSRLTAAFDVFINGTPEESAKALETYFHADYKQHNPDGSDGIEGFLAAQMSAEVTPRWHFTKLHKLIGEGNYVLAISEGEHVGVHSVFYDLVRFEDGKVAEHWDVIQAIPTKGLANTNTMFNFD